MNKYTKIFNQTNQMVAEIQNFMKSDKTRTEDHLINTLPGTSQSSAANSDNKLKFFNGFDEADEKDMISLCSIESFVCRICHNNENPERLISPCLCKGSMTYVHIHCLERWISMSRCATCELCHFEYNTEQTLRYNLYQSIRIWYSRPMTRRALQEDCQMFLLLTIIAFGIVGTLLVAVQFYISQGQVSDWGRIWTKGWLIFFLLTMVIVYLINVYLLVKAQLIPWYRWWQTARDIRLILENHNPPYVSLKEIKKENSNLVVQVTHVSERQDAQKNSSQKHLQTELQSDESQ